MMDFWHKLEIFQVQDGGRTPYWKSFLAISRCHIGQLKRNLERWRLTCRYRSRDQNSNFRKCKMADGRHFKNNFVSKSQRWIIQFGSNLADGCRFPFPASIFDKKNRNFTNSRWRTDAILKIVFGYISASHWPIKAKFGAEMKNHMQIKDTWPKRQFSQIQDGRRPPYWKSFYILAAVCESWIADVESHANRCHVTKRAIFDNSTRRQPLRWK